VVDSNCQKIIEKKAKIVQDTRKNQTERTAIKIENVRIVTTEVTLITATGRTGIEVIDMKEAMEDTKRTKEPSQMMVILLGRTIYINHLSQTTTEDDLKEVFKKFGEIVSCKIIRDQSNDRSKEFGFIQYAEKEMAEKSVVEMNDTVLGLKPIKVEISKRRGPRKQTPGRYMGPRTDRDPRGNGYRGERFYNKGLSTTKKKF